MVYRRLAEESITRLPLVITGLRHQDTGMGGMPFKGRGNLTAMTRS
jgi:hypothetical protein